MDPDDYKVCRFTLVLIDRSDVADSQSIEPTNIVDGLPVVDSIWPQQRTSDRERFRDEEHRILVNSWNDGACIDVGAVAQPIRI